MAQIPAGTRFIGIATSVDLVERKSAVLNSQTEPFTIEDIVNSVPAAPSFVRNATNTALSLSTLNTTYPSLAIGSSVYCTDISTGGLVYMKISSNGWVSASITTVS